MAEVSSAVVKPVSEGRTNLEFHELVATILKTALNRDGEGLVLLHDGDIVRVDDTKMMFIGVYALRE